MRIRPIKMVPEYEHAPAQRDLAERSFLRALHREKALGPAVPPPPGRASIGPPTLTPRARGQSFGRAFAQISGADYDQVVSFARAIHSGVQEAAEREDEAREIAQDGCALRELGFGGCDDDF